VCGARVRQRAGVLCYRFTSHQKKGAIVMSSRIPVLAVVVLAAFVAFTSAANAGGPEACCSATGSCTDESPGDCTAGGGTPQGPGTSCSASVGACCFPNTGCMNVDPVCCDDLGGSPEGPQLCADDVTTWCCLPDGSCIGSAISPCCNAAGGWYPQAGQCMGDGNGNGIDDGCEDPLEPEGCCYPDGDCAVVLPDDCLAASGIPQGPGTGCYEVDYSCCLSDGTCNMVDWGCCDDLYGTLQGPSDVCTDVSPCCIYDGTCRALDPVCCDDEDGKSSPISEPACLGDVDANGIDDACECPPDMFCYVVDDDVQPEVSVLQGIGGDPDRIVAAALSPDGSRDEFVQDEVVLYAPDPGTLSAFIAAYNAEVLLGGPLPTPPESVPPEAIRPEYADNHHYLLRVNPSLADMADLEQHMQQLELLGTFRFSSWPAAQLNAIIARERVVTGLDIGANMVGRMSSADCVVHKASEYVDPNTGLHRDAFDFEWLRDPELQVTRAWQYYDLLELAPAPVYLAMVDSGFAFNADFPPAASVPQYDIPSGANSVDGLENPTPCGAKTACRWHGTGAFGVAAAILDNGFGTAGTSGPVGSPFLFRHDGSAYGTSIGIQTATFWGAHVINVSLAVRCNLWCQAMGGFYDFRVVAEAAAAGAVVTVTAGNQGEDLVSHPRIPCVFPDAICVSGINLDTRACYANFGSPVDIWAPDNGILTTPDPDTSGPATGYSGTCASSAYTAGIVTLMRAVNPNLTVSDVRSILQTTSNPSSDPKVDPGYLDAYEAVKSAAATAGVQPQGDAHEPNDDPTTATVLSLGTLTATIAPGDWDYFHVETIDYMDIDVRADCQDRHTPGNGLQIYPDWDTSHSFDTVIDINRTLVKPADHVLYVAGQSADSINCYDLTFSMQTSTIAPDRFDDQTPAGEHRNDEFEYAAEIQGEVQNNIMRSTLHIDELNHDTTADVDFFTIHLAPGAGECSCGSGGDVIQGQLHLKIIPDTIRPFQIRWYDSEGAEPVPSKLGLGYTLDCPHDYFPEGEITFSVQDVTSRNFYDIGFRYHHCDAWLLADWFLEYDPPLFNVILPEFVECERLLYPLDPDVQEGYFAGTVAEPFPPEYLIFDWGHTGPYVLDVSLPSGGDLDLTLINELNEVVATADWRARTDRAGVPPTKRLEVPDLPPGIYYLRVDGGSFGTYYEVNSVVDPMPQWSQLPHAAGEGFDGASELWAGVPFAYTADDGSSESGVAGGNEYAWIQHFTTHSGLNQVTAVSTCFGADIPDSAGVTAGQDFRVYVWSDPNGDGDPSDAVLLAEATDQIDVASIDTDDLQTVSLGPVGVTDSFFIGASVVFEPGDYPAPLDQSEPLHHQSWSAFATVPPFDPTDLASQDLANMDDVFPGNWLLRATATGINSVMADDFISDGRPVSAVRWWGSYLDPLYVPQPEPEEPYVVDGWLISFHYTEPETTCPPDALTGSDPTALGVYFAPTEAVDILGPLHSDCLGHEVYEYNVDLRRCCLLCSEADPRPEADPSYPAEPEAFYEAALLGYWMGVQAVVGMTWDPQAECAMFATGHGPPIPLIDGMRDSTYDAEMAVQDTPTGFGDSNLGLIDFANGSELDAAYARGELAVLSVVLTGNLESNFNKLEIFFDTVPGGQNRLRGDNPDVDLNGLNRMGDDGSGNGLTFDAGFEADYWIGVSGGNDPYELFASWAELLIGGGGVGHYLGSTVAGSDGWLGGGVNPLDIRVTINNANTNGITDTLADYAAATSVATGIELAVPLAAIGDPSPGTPIKICAFINGIGHEWVSNQVLAPIGGGANLGEPRDVDFEIIAGEQFFTIDTTSVGHMWGWHTSPALTMDQGPGEQACSGRIVDATPYPSGCWDYGAWDNQSWLCPGDPEHVDMAFELLTMVRLGDCTGDRRVDLDDHKVFASCLSGPDGGLIAPECECADTDLDDDVDLKDFTTLQRVFGGS